MTDELTGYLIKFTQTVLKRKFQARQYNFDLSKLSEVKLFKLVEADFDQDGQSETCFVAGLPSIWGESVCGLLDFQASEPIIELTSAEGFRDLQVFDINQDGILEIVALWQVGSGAFLSLSIFQWDGETVKSLFPKHPENGYHQGFMELKDLDADGVDEIIIWQGLWEEGARWQPQRFNIHVFHYNNKTYNLVLNQTSQYRYYPASIISREIGIGGQPLAFEHRHTQLDEYQQRLMTLIHSPKAIAEFIDELDKHFSTLQHEGFYTEALAIANLALEATEYVEDPVTRLGWRINLWREKGVALTFLGDYSNAINCYLQLLSNWTQDAYLQLLSNWTQGVNVNARALEHRYPAYHRELGFMYSMIGDYEHALTFLSTAQNLLESLDLSVQENREQLSSLYSNFGLTYTRLGNMQRAIASFKKAIDLDRELERKSGLAINYMGLGNVYRIVGWYQDAIKSYQTALATLDEVSERDRESDIYLELGLTLILNHQIEEGLNYLNKALLLASVGSLKQRGAIQYLYLGLGYSKSGNLQQAKQYFNRAIAFADEFKTVETKWQALYGVALIYQQQQHNESCQDVLLQAISIIEQMRSQYLPEDLKVSLFVDKIKPYETMVLSSLPHKACQAFNFVERAKSRVFMEQLAITPVGNTVDIPPDLFQREAELINDLRQLQHQHRQAANQHYSWGNEIDQIESELEHLWEKISNTGSKGTEYVELRRATPLDFNGMKLLLTNLN
jgi:tetratricopeptide (TPR) repeat protein